MRWSTVLSCCTAVLLTSCAAHEPPLPPVPPVPDDLPATWSAPEVVQGSALPVPPPLPPPVRTQGENERLYPYVEGKEYPAEIGPGWPLTVVLEAGERFTGLVGGDRPLLAEGEQPPWDIKQTPEGAAQQHVFLTVTKPGLRMGMVITTDRRTYYVTVKSVPATKIRAIRWTYPPRPVAPPLAGPALFPSQTTRTYLHVGYHIDTRWPVPDWAPVQVVDNGKKIFVLFPPTMLYQEAPLVRGIGANGPYLLNSRQIDRVLIVDHLAARLELRIGAGPHAEVVKITRRELQRVTCPGDLHCPVWPQEPAWVADGGR